MDSLSQGLPFIPGSHPPAAGPLGRFFPPLPDGVVTEWLHRSFPPPAWVLDPFGASPRLIIEAARAGYRVLAAIHNPIVRFILDLYAKPPSEAELRATLADLAASQKAGERLEPHLRALYRTPCAHCGTPVEAQAFLWEKQPLAPIAAFYNCPQCRASGEHPLSEGERARLGRFSGSTLHYARALERVAPLADPHRAFAEEALTMYLPRSVYALFTLVNKLESLSTPQRRNLAALLLAAFDQTNALWAYPVTRSRPKQLTLPTRFLERNVWLALEEAVAQWSAVLPDPDAAPLLVTTWPHLPPKEGGICLYEGRLKGLAAEIAAHRASVTIQAVVSALPRPNQALWTLSALWAGWLWGQEASAPFKAVLRRRRYDWDWHTQALYAAFYHLTSMVAAEIPFLGLMGEVETGFLAAALCAAELAAFDLISLALRPADGQAQILWRRSSMPPAERLMPAVDAEQRQSLTRQAIATYLRQRGEPATYLEVQAAALSTLAQKHRLIANPQLPADRQLASLSPLVDGALLSGDGFVRFGSTSRSLESGLWWLDESAPGAQPQNTPLADRVEMEVVGLLLKAPTWSALDLERRVCEAFPGLWTPPHELIQECLVSYGQALDNEAERWRLRPEDSPAARRRDLEEMSSLLGAMGRRLGFQVNVSTGEVTSLPIIRWIDLPSGEGYCFFVMASALLGQVVFPFAQEMAGRAEGLQPAAVLPAGRANLVQYKVRHDPRLAQALQESGWRLIKFRLVRRLAEDPNLDRQNFEALLALDPLENRDPQLSLL